MHVITRTALIRFWESHPNAEPPLRTWYKLTSQAQWSSFVEVRRTFPSADLVGKFTVFNIGGNRYRLIALVDFTYQKVFVRHVLTHAEYDKEAWKNDPWYR
jgi:mRNA interferase HigB